MKAKIVVIGSLNMDIVVQTPRLPVMGETILGRSVKFVPGGKGANQAIGLARLGSQVALIGSVGQDIFGGELLNSLQAGGVNCAGVKKIESSETGVAFIVLAQGDNSIIVVPGANAYCTPADIDDQMEVIKSADIVLMQIEIPLETVTYAALAAKRLKKHVILNPAPAQKLPPELLACVDVITPNETELSLLTDGQGSMEEQMDALLTQGVRQVIVTLGAQGAAFKEQDKPLQHFSAHRVKVVDTTGAGDAFNAGLAYYLASGYPIEQAIGFANKVAAISVGRFGAQQGMPTLDEAKLFSE